MIKAIILDIDGVIVETAKLTHRLSIGIVTIKNHAMQFFTTAQAQKQMATIIDTVRFKNRPVAIGEKNEKEVLVIKFPKYVKKSLTDITNLNAYGGSFDFLNNEPDLYSVEDIKKAYV